MIYGLSSIKLVKVQKLDNTQNLAIVGENEQFCRPVEHKIENFLERN